MTCKSLRTFPKKTTTSSPLTKGSSSCLGTSSLDAPDLKGMNWTLEPMLPTVCVSKPLPSSSRQHQSKFEDKSLLLSTFPVGHWKIDRKLHPGKVGHQVPLRQGIVRTGPSFPHFNVLRSCSSKTWSEEMSTFGIVYRCDSSAAFASVKVNLANALRLMGYSNSKQNSLRRAAFFLLSVFRFAFFL